MRLQDLLNVDLAPADIPIARRNFVCTARVIPNLLAGTVRSMYCRHEPETRSQLFQVGPGLQQDN